jgi:hypothetical protein
MQVADQFRVMATSTKVVSDMLAGRHVWILPKSPLDDGEKKAITELVISLDGKVTFMIKAGRQPPDIVVAGSAPAKRYAAELRAHVRNKAGHDVVRAAWLADCKARGKLIEPAPAHYLHVSDATIARHVSAEGYDKCAAHGF